MIDIWLYISLGGFVLSLLLWFYFFSKYRSIDQPSDPLFEQLLAEAKAQPSVMPTPLSSPTTEPVPINLSTPPVSGAVSTIEHTEAQPTSTEPEMEHAAPTNRINQTSPSGTSPAVVYLQNLTERLESLHKDLEAVRSQISSIGQKNEAQLKDIQKRLEEINRATHKSTKQHPHEATGGSSPALETGQSEPEIPPSSKRGPVWPS